MQFLKIYAVVVFPMCVAIYWFAVRGREINWVGLFRALPGIFANIACQLWIDISAPFRHRRKSKVIDLDEYERKLS